MVVVLLAGCVVEWNDRPPAYVVLNGTDEVVEIRYLTERSDLTPEGLEGLRSVVVLDPGQEYRFTIPREDDGCLDAPLAAVTLDGTEIDRLPAGTCADKRVRPTWTVTDE